VDFAEEPCFLTQRGQALFCSPGSFARGDGAMIQFELAEPTTLTSAVRLLDPDDETIRPVAGGTALMLMMKAGVFRPAKLVSLRKIESQYAAITADARGLTIGAMATLSDLEHSADACAYAPLVTKTLLTLSNVRVRNVATVGGALAHGDPHMDLPPVLMALDASLTVVGPKGERSLPVEDLFTGYYETVLALNELIAFVHVPAQRGKQAAYMKVTTGATDDWPALGIAVAIVSDVDAIRSARIVASAATEKAIRLTSAEAVLQGNRIDDKLLRRAADAAVEEVEFVSDVRGSAPYKRELMRVYVQRAVRAALDESGEP
jgi:carbon-monoxide dehydrogenase medium subunit